MFDHNLVVKKAVFNRIRHANTGNLATHCKKLPETAEFIRLPYVFNKVRYHTF